MPGDKNEINFDIELDKLAKRIKRLRVAKGYTSYEVFAFENSINRVQYGRYEKGNDLRYTTLLKVIKALDMTPAEFFSEGFD
ncbi:MAG: helix-turn-helix transcriptional regulator [Chloroflexia bacterium]|nr:helix-turn-helix transcriptional regulator [Chloroflexia bacterium]